MILIPEIRFTFAAIRKKIEARETQGKHFTIVIVAEGAALDDRQIASDSGAGDREIRLGGIGHEVAARIESLALRADVLARMAERARAVGRPDAVGALADLVEPLVNGNDAGGTSETRRAAA